MCKDVFEPMPIHERVAPSIKEHGAARYRTQDRRHNIAQRQTQQEIPHQRTPQLPDIIESDKWHEYAACKSTKNVDSIFFSDNVKKQEAAKEICKSCPVLLFCRDDILTETKSLPSHGIWAAMTVNEVRAERRKIAKKKSKQQALS